jgi:hypothetical protein
MKQAEGEQRNSKVYARNYVFQAKKENTLSPVSTVIISVIRLSLLNISARQEIAGNLSEIIGRQNFNSAQRARKHQILIFLFAALKGSFTVLCLCMPLSPLSLAFETETPKLMYEVITKQLSVRGERERKLGRDHKEVDGFKRDYQ